MLMQSCSKPGWGPRLPETFKAHGFEDVVFERFVDEDDDLPNFHDNVLLSAEEMSNFVEDGEEFRGLIERASEESVKSQRGVAIAFDHLNVVGRKP